MLRGSNPITQPARAKSTRKTIFVEVIHFPDSSRFVGHSVVTSWDLDCAPNLELEKVIYGCALIQDSDSRQSVGGSDARFGLISGLQLDFRRVALYFNRRAKGL
jgi:hypothetical protein